MTTRVEITYAGLLVLALVGSYFIGKSETAIQVQMENERVTAAIARTMRCSTEAEWEAGIDHQCTAAEIRQDAGLE